MLSQAMPNLNLMSSTSTDLAEGQQQTPPSHSSGPVDDQPQASPGPVSQLRSLPGIHYSLPAIPHQL